MDATKPRYRLAGVALIALGLFFLALTVQKVWSADVWWQLRNGEWIVANRAVPRAEMYSHTMAGNPLREMRWVWCVLLYLGWTHAGAWLLVLGQVAVLAGTWLAVAWPNRRAVVGGLGPLGVLVVGLGLAAGFGRWVMRPEIVTFLMIAAFLAILQRHTTSGRSRAAWLLIPLQIVWTNTHTLFLFGPLLVLGFLGAALTGRLLVRTPAAKYATLAPTPAITARLFIPLLVIPAIWANPYGTYGAAYIVQMWNESRAGNVTAQIVGEMRSPLAMPLGAWTWDLYAAGVLAVLVGATFILARPRLDLRALGVFAVGLYLACSAQRNVALFAVMGAWAGLVNLRGAEEERHAERGGTRRRIGNAMLGAVLAFAAWYVATDRYAVRMNLTREFGLGVVEWNQPRATAAFLREHRPAGNLFNVMRDGSYFVWALKGDYPVFVDGRTDAYGPAFLDEFARVGPASWDALAEKHDLGVAVIPNYDYQDLVDHLRGSPSWALVHLDATSLVFVLRAPVNAALIAAHEIDRTGEGVDIPPGGARSWHAAFGGVSRPRHDEGYALSYFAIDSPANARRHLVRAVAQYPAAVRPRVLLAPLLTVAGDAAGAAALLEGLGEVEQALAARETARLLVNAGRKAEAVAPLERAVRLLPDDPELRLALADLHFQAGAYAEAREGYIAYLRRSPAAGGWAKLGVVYEQLRQPDAAADAFEKSLALDPAQPAVWNMLGAAHGRAGDLAAARRCFEKALELKPDFEAARRNLGRLP